jgi:hypothetical protein
MRRWDRLVDAYIEEYTAVGFARARCHIQRRDCDMGDLAQKPSVSAAAG